MDSLTDLINISINITSHIYLPRSFWWELLSFLSYMSAKWRQSCPTLCDPMDFIACQAPLSMGILQARTLEWVAMPSSRGSSWPRDSTQASCTGRRILYHWARKPNLQFCLYLKSYISYHLSFHSFLHFFFSFLHPQINPYLILPKQWTSTHHTDSGFLKHRLDHIYWLPMNPSLR